MPAASPARLSDTDLSHARMRTDMQVLNVAWAGHEIVSDYMDAAFAFWERPAPDDVELQPMAGLAMPKQQLRGGALWTEQRGITGRKQLGQ